MDELTFLMFMAGAVLIVWVQDMRHREERGRLEGMVRNLQEDADDDRRRIDELRGRGVLEGN